MVVSAVDDDTEVAVAVGGSGGETTAGRLDDDIGILPAALVLGAGVNGWGRGAVVGDTAGGAATAVDDAPAELAAADAGRAASFFSALTIAFSSA